MYKFRTKLNEVLRVIPFKNSFVYSSIKGVVFFKGKEIIRNIDGASIYKISNSLIQIWKNDGGYYYFDDIIYSCDYNIFINNNSIISLAQSLPRRVSRGVYLKDIYIFNKKTNSIGNIILKDCEENIVFFNDKNLVLSNNTQLHAYTLPTAQPLWQFDLGVLGTFRDSNGETQAYEVRQFVGVYEEELLVLLSDFRFVAFNIQTGKKTKDIHIPQYISCTDGDYFANSGVHIDNENKRLIWLSGTMLFHIEISTFKLSQIKNFWHVPQNEKWRFMSSTLHQGLLYFTGDKGMEYVVATRIGVMNAETGEILWQQQIEKTGGLPNAPQVNNDKLYVLTVNKELYIFQKENPCSAKSPDFAAQ